jgi:hypothetical protein
MLFMVVERFRNGNPESVYARFRERGRMAPDGLRYASIWVDTGLGACYQLMETHDRTVLDEWMAAWSDLVTFEVHEVIDSDEAAARVAARTAPARLGPSRESSGPAPSWERGADDGT